MRDFLVVIVGLYLLGASVEMSTGMFVQHFPKWTNADQVKVICNGIMIAQYCDNQTCRQMNSPGVSLEKAGSGLCLTITNCTYNSWSCEAQSYIRDDQQTEKFTVDCNQHTSTSPSPGAPITSPSPGAPITSPSPGNNESHSGAIAAGVTVPIICLVLMMIILYVLYRKVERFKQPIRDFFSILQRSNRNPDEEMDSEAGDSEAGDGEAGKFLQPVCGTPRQM